MSPELFRGHTVCAYEVLLNRAFRSVRSVRELRFSRQHPCVLVVRQSRVHTPRWHLEPNNNECTLSCAKVSALDGVLNAPTLNGWAIGRRLIWTVINGFAGQLLLYVQSRDSEECHLGYCSDICNGSPIVLGT